MIKSNKQDAEFCGKVPIHQTNQIQPHGILIVIDKEDFSIIQVSENITNIIDKNIDDILEKPLSNFIKADEIKVLQEKLSLDITTKIPFTLTFDKNGNEQHFSALIHQKEGIFIAELEIQTQDAAQSFYNSYYELKYAKAAIDNASSIEEVCKVAATELKKISGFDKIMIYQFDEEWNGTVIAEELEEGMESYLGLKFPASDIPKQAREIYKKNAYRLIPNIYYEPVKLLPVINPKTFSFTDLGDTNLRSVVNVHLEYLQNMKITASMSTRITKDGELWGLISCHHRTAKYLTYEAASVFELMSDIVSSKISTIVNQQKVDFKTKMQNMHFNLASSIYKQKDVVDGINNVNKDLMNLLNADGIALSLENTIRLYGTTPSKDDVSDIILWLQSNNIHKTYQQSSLSNEFEPAENYAENSSGLLALPVQPEKGSYILAFRSEAKRKINWGGNPNEVIKFEPNNKNYHPRNSFQLWQQSVEKTSIPWKNEELEVAENFRNFVMEYTLNKRNN